MSKATLRKAIADFDAAQMRELLTDIYDRSREAKELLDFYADPDIERLHERFIKLISKEVWRVKHRKCAPRIREIRSLVRRFEHFDPGEAAVGRLMAETSLELCHLAQRCYLEDSQAENFGKFLSDTRAKLISAHLWDEYEPRLHRQIASICPDDRFCYTRTLWESRVDGRG